MPLQRVLITGATGLIGARILRDLAAVECEIVVLTRDATRSSAFLPASAEIHEWKHPESEPPPAAAFSPRVDAVIHLAGETIAQRWTPSAKKRIFDSRILSTRQLGVRLASLPSDLKPEVLVSASAVGIYGPDAEGTLDESDPSAQTSEGFLADVCRQWESEARAAAQAAGMRSVQMRNGVVLAAEGGALAKLLPLFKLGLGGKQGSGEQWMSWISLTDVARAFVLAAESRAIQGPVNAVAPEPVTNRAFMQELGRALKRPAWLPVPSVILKAATGEMSQVLLTGQRVRPAQLLEHRMVFAHPELGACLRELVGHR